MSVPVYIGAHRELNCRGCGRGINAGDDLCSVCEKYLATRVESEAYRGCPWGRHEPGEPHHYSCWVVEL